MLTAAIAFLAIQTKDPLVGTWTYRATTDDGKLVAEGKLAIRLPTPAERRKIHLTKGELTYLGTKDVRCVDPAKYGPHANEPARAMQFKVVPTNPGAKLPYPTPNQIAGTRSGGKVHLDLNKGWFDHNIWLDGNLKGNQVTGTWGWSAFAGVRVKGKFHLTRAKK